MIFCSKSILAAYKFLKIAWDKNKINGEANFDIDEDNEGDFQYDFFKKEQLTKVDAFKKRLAQEIIDLKIKDNVGAYKYTISQGFIPKHAREAIKRLIETEKIIHKGQIPLSHKSCIKDKKIVNFILKDKN